MPGAVREPGHSSALRTDSSGLLLVARPTAVEQAHSSLLEQGQSAHPSLMLVMKTGLLPAVLAPVQVLVALAAPQTEYLRRALLRRATRHTLQELRHIHSVQQLQGVRQQRALHRSSPKAHQTGMQLPHRTAYRQEHRTGTQQEHQMELVHHSLASRRNSRGWEPQRVTPQALQGSRMARPGRRMVMHQRVCLDQSPDWARGERHQRVTRQILPGLEREVRTGRPTH